MYIMMNSTVILVSRDNTNVLADANACKKNDLICAIRSSHAFQVHRVWRIQRELLWNKFRLRSLNPVQK